MKNYLILPLLFLTLLTQAQEKRKNLSLHYGLGNGSLFTFEKMDGGGNREGNSLTNFGLNYSYELRSKNLFLETGFEHLTYKYTLSSFYPPSPPKSWDYTATLISFPVKLRYEAGKYFFFNGNLYLDIDVSKGTGRGLSGIGTGLGAGLQYYFKNKFGVYVNPQLELRNLASFSGSPYKLASTQIAFGLTYRIKGG